MWRLAAALTVALAGHPVALHPSRFVVIGAVVAAAACGAGIALRSSRVLSAGVGVALAAYTLALALAETAPRPGAAIATGLVALLLLQAADFDRRFRGVAKSRALCVRQLAGWGAAAAAGGVVAVVLLGAATVVAATIRLPWPPLLAGGAAFTALTAAALTLRRSTRDGAEPGDPPARLTAPGGDGARDG